MKKILFSSDCNGNFQLLFSKVSQLSLKTKFDMMFLTGNVLPLQSTKQFSLVCKGEIKVPIPTYFITTGPMSKILNLAYPERKELAQNFVFLGRKGVKNVQGLNVCWLNGVSSIEKSVGEEYKSEFYDQSDVKEIVKLCQNKPIDILITNQWPQEISTTYSKVILQQHDSPCQRSPLISLLSYKLSPKYHLVASGRSFYRMQPFKSSSKSLTYTHFINVAQMNKSGLKDKYLLAVQTVPLQMNPSEEVIANSVGSPFDENVYEERLKELQQGKKIEKGEDTKFTEQGKRIGFKESLKLKQKRNKYEQTANFINQSTYVYFDSVPFQSRNDDIHQFLQRWGKVTKLQVFKQHKGGFKSGIAKFSTLQSTKQCLSDSGKFSLYQSRIKFKPKQVEQKYRHQDCWFCQKNEKFDRSLLVYKGRYCMICLDKGPVTEWHLQIVPVNHVDTIGKLQRVQVEEIQHVIAQLKRYFHQKKYQTITAQRYMKLSQQISHTLIQFIAIPSPGIIHRFHQLNQQQRLNFTSLQPDTKRKSQYFVKIEINQSKFLKEIWPKEKVEFQFVRKLVCELINQPARINWRSCERSQEGLKMFRDEVGKVLKECHFGGE